MNFRCIKASFDYYALIIYIIFMKLMKYDPGLKTIFTTAYINDYFKHFYININVLKRVFLKFVN